MPHQAPPSIFGTKMIMRAQHVCDFRLDRLGQKLTSALAQ